MKLYKKNKHWCWIIWTKMNVRSLFKLREREREILELECLPKLKLNKQDLNNGHFAHGPVCATLIVCSLDPRCHLLTLNWCIRCTMLNASI